MFSKGAKNRAARLLAKNAEEARFVSLDHHSYGVEAAL